MPHNDYTNVGGLWPSVIIPTPDAMRRMDQAASECIDGDNGGTWNPSSPIIIGGAGVSLLNNVRLTGVVTGPRAAGGGGIVLTSQFVVLETARTRTTVVPLRDFLTRVDGDSPYNELGAGISAFAAVGGAFSCELPSRRIHRGYTPLSVTLRMRVGARPGSVPVNMPGFNVTRIPSTGLWNPGGNEYFQIAPRANLTAYAIGALVVPVPTNGTQFRCIVAGTSAAAQPAGVTTGTVNFTPVVDGSVSWRCETGPTFGGLQMTSLPRPATVDAYFNAGNYQDITFVPNTLGAWDSATYGHFITVTDASGTLNAFHSVRMTWSLTTLEPLV